MDKLIALFMMIAPLSSDLEDYIRSILKPREVGRKEVILRPGEVARHIYFIEEGLMRSYYWKGNMEVTNWFMKDQDIFVSVKSFFFQQPSRETHEALENTKLWGISYEQLHYAYRHFPEFQVHRGTLLEAYYARLEDTHFMTNGQVALERVRDLVENQADLMQRVPGKYLASYLGMNEATYSIKLKEYYETLRGRNGTV